MRDRRAAGHLGVAGVPIRRRFPGWARSDDCGGHDPAGDPLPPPGRLRRRTHRGLPLPRAHRPGVPNEPPRLGANCAPRSLRAARVRLLGRSDFPFPPAQGGSPVGGDDPHAGFPRDQPAGVRLDALRLRVVVARRHARWPLRHRRPHGRPVYAGHSSTRAARGEPVGHRSRGRRVLLRARVRDARPERLWRVGSDWSVVWANFAVLTGRRGRINGGTGAVAGVVVAVGAACGGRVGSDDGSGFRPVPVFIV